MAALFATLASGLALIAVVAARAGEWVPAVAAGALAAWMASLALAVVRGRRRRRRE
jgi:CHASE2 domain-containing sensor protein